MLIKFARCKWVGNLIPLLERCFARWKAVGAIGKFRFSECVYFLVYFLFILAIGYIGFALESLSFGWTVLPRVTWFVGTFRL